MIHYNDVGAFGCFSGQKQKAGIAPLIRAVSRPAVIDLGTEFVPDCDFLAAEVEFSAVPALS